jgi:flagellar biosynthesis protein
MSDTPKRRDDARSPTPTVAAALGYERDRDAAPRVLAHGAGEIAATILARAAEHGIPIERDPDLLACLAPLRIGREIPVAAYVAVAQLLAFLYRRNRVADE